MRTRRRAALIINQQRNQGVFSHARPGRGRGKKAKSGGENTFGFHSPSRVLRPHKGHLGVQQSDILRRFRREMLYFHKIPCQIARLELQYLKDVGWIAQSVEQRTENPCVAGSIPAPATIPQNLKMCANWGFMAMGGMLTYYAAGYNFSCSWNIVDTSIAQQAVFHGAAGETS